MDERKIQKSVLEESCAIDNHVAGEFPAGLKILIVDDNRTCLLILERMLRKLSYQVTKCRIARDALALLRENKNNFDIVLCDLHLPDMDGFKLLDEIIGLEVDLPVIMMSSDDGQGVVMKGVMHGACDYLVKPLRMETIRLIWQHVVRKKQQHAKLGDRHHHHHLHLHQQPAPPGNNVNRLLILEQPNINAAAAAAAREKGAKDQKELLKDDEEDIDDDSSDEVSTSDQKKPRMIWTQDLHDLFVIAINQLGRDKAVPKRILERMEAMNATGLTRANIASHLQKYRMHLQKKRDKRDANAFLDQQASSSSSFRQCNQQLQFRSKDTSTCRIPVLQNLVAAPRSSTAAVGSISSTDQGSNIFDSIISESNHRLSTDQSSLHGPNLLYPNGYPGDHVAISNDEFLYRNVQGNNVTELPNPLSAVDHPDQLIYDPSFFLRQFDEEIFRGPFV